jgi:hypothetical protein
MEAQIMSCREAKAAGATRYFTGKPCKHGHLAERFVANSYCIKCAEIDRAKPGAAEYQKAYRAQNAEAMAEYYRRRHAENRDSILAARREHAKKNAEHHRLKSHAYYHANKDEVNARVRARRPAFRARDNAQSRTKKARKINATPAWADMTAIKRIYAQAAELGFHVDHIIPLRSKLVCGLHIETNLRPLPPVDNMKKHNSFNPADHEWSFSDLALALNSI